MNKLDKLNIFISIVMYKDSLKSYKKKYITIKNVST